MKKSIVFVAFLGILSLSYAQKKTAVAPTPPMGWNSWNYFACDVSEELIKGMADAMVASGMRDAGYEYVVIDDCWQVSRDENGIIVADPERFPSGMKALADYIHGKGLKFGIYSDAGKQTCQERPGSYGYEVIDAKTYEEWGIDYLKFDWCHNGLFNTSKELYPDMAKALADLDRPIVFSMCNWGRQRPWKWAGEYAHLWRTTYDIVPDFAGKGLFRLSILNILDKQVGLESYAGPDGWNDPDMLQVGNGDLTRDENIAHFSLWCMLAAPLMAGNDLAHMTAEVIEILTNQEVIAVNQDVMGKQGYRISKEKGIEIWVKPLFNHEWAVCVLNRGEANTKVDVNFTELLTLNSPFTVKDLWRHEEIGNTDQVYSFDMPAHSVVMTRLYK